MAGRNEFFRRGIVRGGNTPLLRQFYDEKEGGSNERYMISAIDVGQIADYDADYIYILSGMYSYDTTSPTPRGLYITKISRTTLEIVASKQFDRSHSTSGGVPYATVKAASIVCEGDYLYVTLTVINDGGYDKYIVSAHAKSDLSYVALSRHNFGVSYASSQHSAISQATDGTNVYSFYIYTAGNLSMIVRRLSDNAMKMFDLSGGDDATKIAPVYTVMNSDASKCFVFHQCSNTGTYKLCLKRLGVSYAGMSPDWSVLIKPTTSDAYYSYLTCNPVLDTDGNILFGVMETNWVHYYHRLVKVSATDGSLIWSKEIQKNSAAADAYIRFIERIGDEYCLILHTNEVIFVDASSFAVRNSSLKLPTQTYKALYLNSKVHAFALTTVNMIPATKAAAQEGNVLLTSFGFDQLETSALTSNPAGFTLSVVAPDVWSVANVTVPISSLAIPTTNTDSSGSLIQQDWSATISAPVKSFDYVLS